MKKLILAGFFTKGNIHKQKSYNQKCSCYLGGIDGFNDIHDSNIPSTLTVNNNISIPKKRALVNKNKLFVRSSPDKFGAIRKSCYFVIKATANQPAERLMNNPAKALSHARVKNISITFTLATLLASVKYSYGSCIKLGMTQAGFIRLTKRALTTYLIISTVIVGTGLIYLFGSWAQKSAEAAWSAQHTGWLKRKQLTLVNNSGSTISTSVPYQVTVDTQTLWRNRGDLQSDCDDLRIVYQVNGSSAGTELARAYTIANGATDCSNSSATIITFPLQASITNGSSDTNYYMYYQNPTASSPAATQLSAYNINGKTATFVAPFNGSTTALAAGTATPTTATGAIRYSGGKSALNFDGNNDYVATGDNSIFNLSSTSFTIEAWVYFKKLPLSENDGYIFKEWENGQWIGFVRGSDQKLRLQVKKGGVFPGAVSDAAISVNQWYHIAAVYDGSTVKMYLNGTLQSTTGSAASPLDTGSLYALSFSSVDPAQESTGFILDEFRISNIVRYSSNFTPQSSPFTRDSNTLSLFHLDENGDDPRNTGKAIDDSGNANHGTITGAKYVGGLIGIDSGSSAGMTEEGKQSTQSYAGHQGVFIEEGTTNKITNPSFEHATYATGWTAAGSNLTATQNTTAPYYKFGISSEKLVANASAISGTSNMRTISINAGNTNTHTLSAYVYDGTTGNIGGTVSSSIAKLVYNGTAQTTTYTDMGGGWWRLSYSTTGVNGAAEYGVETQVSKTIYIDGVQLEELTYATSYTDGSLGSSYSWTGTANNSTSSRTVAKLNYSSTNNYSANAGSISFWHKKNSVRSVDALQALFYLGTSLTNYIDAYYYSVNDLDLRIDMKQNNNSVSCGNEGTSMDPQEWHYFTITWVANSGGSDTCQIYLDGAASGTGPTGQSWSFSPSGDLAVGMLGPNSASQANASISDFRIYSSALTAGDVADLYNQGLGSHSQGYSEEKDKPSLYWKFDDAQGTTAQDSSRNNLDGTLNNTPTWTTEDQCILGKCLYFDGTNNENVSVSDNATLDFAASDDFTLSAWVKRNGASSAVNYIITKAQSGYTGYKLYQDASGDYCFDVSDGTNTDTACTSAVEFDDNNWHHVSGVKSGTSSITLYVDGNQRATDGSILATGTLANTGTFYAGVDLDGTSNEWLGFIDEVRVIPTALTAAQILSEYNLHSSQVLGLQRSEPLSEGLVGYWKMDDNVTGDAQSLVDASGNANTGTTHYGANTTGMDCTVAGKYGPGCSVDGTDDYVSSTNNSGVSGAQTFTMSIWANTNATGDTAANKYLYNAMQLGTWNDTANGVQINYNEKTIAVASYNGSELIYTPASDINGQWHNVVVTYNGSVLTFYLDGVVINKQNSLTLNLVASKVWIGSSSQFGETGMRFFNGKLDEVRVYNRALSNAEVSQLYNFAPEPLVYYNFEDATGTNVTDRGTSANNGTWNGTGSHWVDGKFGKTGNFTGTSGSDYIGAGSATNIDNIPNSGMTVDFWLKQVDGTADSFYNLINKDNNGANGWGIYSNNGNRQTTFNVDLATTDISLSTGSTPFANNTWIHIAATLDTTNTSAVAAKIYMNGVLSTSTAAGVGAYVTDAARNLEIGRQNANSTNRLNGNLDDLKIYNYVRTQGQIIEDMNAGHPAPGSPVGTPVSAFRFDEGALNTCSDGGDFCDDSINRNDLDFSTTTGGFTLSGKFGKAFNGDGTVWASRTTDSDLEFAAADSFTISTWFKSDAAANPANGIEYLVADTTGNTDKGFAIYANTDGTICFGIDDDTTWGPDVSSCTSGDFYDGNWHYLTAVRDTVADTTNLYIDAISRDSDEDSTSATLDGDNTFYVGDFDGDNNGTTGIEEFAGDIDELKIYRSALTAEQVKLDMNRGSSQVLGALSQSSGSTDPGTAASQEYCIPGDSTSCAAPVGRYDFEEKTAAGGATINDTSGTGNTMTVNNNSSLVFVKPGKLGSGLNFTGTTDANHRLVSNSTITPPTIVTIETWIKPRSSGGGTSGEIFGSSNSAQASGYFLITSGTSGNFTRLRFRSRYTVNGQWFTNYVIPLNAWSHIAVTYDAGSTSNVPTFYLNGAITAIDGASTVNPTGSWTSTAGNWNIGGDATAGVMLDAIIDSVRIFNYARTPAQIAWDYNRGGPVAHWDMDECQGTTVNDSSGNTNTGTLSIGASVPQTSAGTCQTVDTATAWYNGRSGKRNYSINFDGTDDSATVANTVSNVQSVSYWVKPATNTSSMLALTASAYITSSSGTVSATGFTSPTIYVNGIANGTITGGAWNFVTVTTGTGISASAITLGLANGTYLNGQLDDVKLFNYALTATQVKLFYDNGAINYGPNVGSP